MKKFLISALILMGSCGEVAFADKDFMPMVKRNVIHDIASTTYMTDVLLKSEGINPFYLTLLKDTEKLMKKLNNPKSINTILNLDCAETLGKLREEVNEHHFDTESMFNNIKGVK